MSIDHQGDRKPDSFYWPSQSAETIERNNQERELSIAQLSIVEEVVADVTALYDKIRDIEGLKSVGGTTIEVQLEGRKFIRGELECWAEKWESRLKKNQDAATAAPDLVEPK